MIAHRRLDIQGLRAIAVLMVVAFHAGLPFPGGFVGVDVFFVISGFVITGMLVREWATTGTIRFRHFYARRFKRLTPALALTVGVTLVLALALMSPLGTQQTAAQTGIGAMLLVANIVIARTTGGYFDAAADTNPLLNTWSLSVEEQFYLVFPLILLAGWLLARRFGRAWPVLIVAVVTAASFGIALASTRGPLPFVPGELVGFYGPLSRAWEFGVGALLALAASRPGWKVPRAGVAVAASTAGLLLVLISLWLLSASTPGPGVRNLIPVAGTALLLWGGAQPDSPITKLLSTRPFVWLGDLSYSWYLWHWPLIVFAGLLWPSANLALVLAAVVSLLPAIASYRWVEQPIRLRRVTGGTHWARLIAVVMVPPIAIGAALLYAASQGYWSSTVREYQAARTSHADTASGCVDVPADADVPPAHCVWNASAPGAPIYLLGDSNAGHFSEAVIAAGEALDRPVHIYAVHGCPFIDAAAAAGPSDDPGDCARYVDRTIGWLADQPAGTVMLSSSSTPWAPADRATGGLTEGGGPGPDDAYLAQALVTTIDDITAAGHEVELLQILPHFTREPYVLDYAHCSAWALMSGGCTQQMPRAFADEMQHATMASYAAAARETGVPLIDLRSTLCPEEVCRTELNGVPVYLDGGHISVATSASLASALTD